MTLAANSHIEIDRQGVARIDGTRMKVLHLVKEMLARNATVEQLRSSFPQLSLAQVHAALAYYYDHQAQIDAQIKQESAEFEAAKSKSAPTVGREKLRARGRRP